MSGKDCCSRRSYARLLVWGSTFELIVGDCAAGLVHRGLSWLEYRAFVDFLMRDDEDDVVAEIEGDGEDEDPIEMTDGERVDPEADVELIEMTDGERADCEADEGDAGIESEGEALDSDVGAVE